MTTLLGRLVHLFDSMVAKDWLTLVIATSALIVSAASFKQKSKEAVLALRKQLTDIFDDLTTLNAENAKASYSQGSAAYPPNYYRWLNDKRRFLVRQAEFISRRINDLVSPYEFLMIAGAFDSTDDVFQAEHFYRIAINRAKGPVDSGIATRNYARFLFDQGRLDEARQFYAKGVECFPLDSDRMRFYAADTFERWSSREREWGQNAAAADLLKQSREIYETLSNPTRRASEVDRISRILNPPPTPASHKDFDEPSRDT